MSLGHRGRSAFRTGGEFNPESRSMLFENVLRQIYTLATFARSFTLFETFILCLIIKKNIHSANCIFNENTIPEKNLFLSSELEIEKSVFFFLNKFWISKLKNDF